MSKDIKCLGVPLNRFYYATNHFRSFDHWKTQNLNNNENETGKHDEKHHSNPVFNQ